MIKDGLRYKHLKSEEYEPSIVRDMVRLMREAFGNYELLYEHFLCSLAKEHECSYVCIDETSGQLIASLQSVPFQLEAELGQWHKIAYFYALITAPSMRGKSVMKHLMQFACDDLLKRRSYTAAVLIPSEPSLISYYEKHHFVKMPQAWSHHTVSTPSLRSILPLPTVVEYLEWEKEALLQHYQEETASEPDGAILPSMIRPFQSSVLEQMDMWQLCRPLL